MDLLLVKLGGSLITDKSRPFTERTDVIERLAKEIHEARKERKFKMILGHGGGSYPHKPAKDYETHKGFTRADSQYGFAKVQDAAARLNRIIVDTLIKQRENAISVSPSSCCVAENDRIVDFYTRPLELMLDSGMLPVVYGDAGLDLKKGCCILSTEEILNFLAVKLAAKRIIMAGKTSGVFTSDPNKDKNAQHIREINQSNFDSVKNYLTDSDGIDVTGGMLLKVSRAMEMASKGIETEVINGSQAEHLKKALLGEAGFGTIIK